MFHIGVATQHPPLPDPDQLSPLGIGFIKDCLDIDPMRRPTAQDLLDHPWMIQFRETMLSYEEAEIAADPPSEMPSQEEFETATIARHAAIMQEKEVEQIKEESPDPSPSSPATASASSKPSLLLPST